MSPTTGASIALTTLLLASSSLRAAAAAPSDSRPRVATIVVGADAAAAGDLQRELDDRVAALPQARALDAQGLAAALALPVPSPKPRDPVLAAKAAALFDQATAAYYRDKGAQALELLDEVGRIQDADAQTPPADRVRWQLWRMAVYLALGDRTQADTAALSALALDPQIQVDLSEFPPSMQDAISELRQRRGRTVTLLLSGLASNATVLLDGRPAAARNQVFAGRHRVSASAPGRRDLTRVVDAVADTSVRLSMPLLLDTAMDAALTGIVARGQVLAADAPVLGDVARRTGAEWLVLGGTGRAARAMAIHLASGRPFATSDTVPVAQAATLGGWTVETLAKFLPPVRDASARRPARGVPVTASTWTLETEGGLVVADRSRDVRGTGGRPLHARFLGTGPRVSAAATRGLFTAGVDAEWLDYGISWMDVTLPDGTNGRVRGGSLVGGAAFAGARVPLGADDPDGAALSFLAAFSTESLEAEDVVASGTKLGAFSNRTRNALEARIAGRVPLTQGIRPVAVTFGVAGAPWSSWSERPAGTTGASPSPAVAFSWRAGLDLGASRSLAIRISYEGEERTVRYGGAARGVALGGMTDARESDLVQSVSVSAGWRF